MSGRPGVLIFEQAELHLHPCAQTRLAEAAKNAPEVQVYRVNQECGETQVEKIDPSPTSFWEGLPEGFFDSASTRA